MLRIALVIFLLLFTSLKLQALEVYDAWAHPNYNNISTSALYLKIFNDKEDDRLLSVQADIAKKARVNKTIIEKQIVKIIKINNLIIPKNFEIKFAPGAIFIYLEGLTKQLHLEDEFKVVLHFENAGTKTIIAKVRNIR